MDKNTASSATPIAVYLYAGDQIIENVTTGYFYYQDSLGNTSHVTDAAGNLLERYTYSAFGTPTFYNAAGTQIVASAYGIRHLFQGQLWTQETGLNDYRNRVEFPTMGVFLQPDPIGFKGDAANIYRFCGNDPVDRTDPLGLLDSSALADRNWQMACFFDSGNSYQSSWEEFNNRNQPARVGSGQAEKWGKPAGNWNDTNIEKHVSNRPEDISSKNGAQTHWDIDVIPNEDGSLKPTSTINWYVRPEHKATDVVTRELEHTERILRWQKDGDGADAIKKFNRSPSGLDSLKHTLLEERRIEIHNQNDDLHGGGRHQLDKYPPIPMNPSDIKKLLENLRY